MNYVAQPRRPSRSLRVGTAASSDPILARASLDASSIMLAMAKAHPSNRAVVMADGLSRLAVPQGAVAREWKDAVAAGENPDQAAFDAMRLGIANARLGRGIENARQLVASNYGWDSVVDGLGAMSDNDRKTGCMIAAGTTTAGGVAQVIPVYGTIVGLVAGIGGSVAGAALDCGKEARDAAAAAAAAQAQLEAAQAQAEAQRNALSASSRSTRVRTIVGGGALLLAALGVAWLIID